MRNHGERATLTLPNGSTYLPGSWADNLTSFGCYFPDTSQTKATAFIAAGAAGTTGAVIEPYNITQRFTNSSIDTFIADGATLGEAFAKSVATPDIQLPLGDMLAQPMADVPTVVINSGPGNVWRRSRHDFHRRFRGVEQAHRPRNKLAGVACRRHG